MLGKTGLTKRQKTELYKKIGAYAQEAIVAARDSGEYQLSEIAQMAGLHLPRISNIVTQAKISEPTFIGLLSGRILSMEHVIKAIGPTPAEREYLEGLAFFQDTSTAKLIMQLQSQGEDPRKLIQKLNKLSQRGVNVDDLLDKAIDDSGKSG